MWAISMLIISNISILYADTNLQLVNHNIIHNEYIHRDFPIRESNIAIRNISKYSNKFVVNKTFKIDLSIVGDVMLATERGRVYEGSFSSYALKEEPKYFFENVADIFKADDFTIINLENVLTDNNLIESTKSSYPAYWYKAPTSNTKILTSSGIDIVNLSNNHTNDYGTQGMIDTKQAIIDSGLMYGSSDSTLYFEKEGYTIALICNGLWYEWQASNIIDRLKEAEAKSDFQIVYYHGGTERVHRPEDWKIRASRSLVDSGADLVIGNHPHVLQPMEIYNDVPIIYSMGNFCFGGSHSEENRTIIFKYILEIDNKSMKKVGYNFDIIPCYVYTDRWKPGIIVDESEKQKVLDFMAWKAASPD